MAKSLTYFEELEEATKSHPIRKSIEKHLPGYAEAFSPSAMGLTKVAALKEFLYPQKFGVKPPGGRIEDIYRSAKIILGYPQKYLDQLRGITYHHPYLADRPRIPGMYDSINMKIGLQPWRTFEQKIPGKTIYEVLNHELSHLVQSATEAKFVFTPLGSHLGAASEATADWLARQHGLKVSVPYKIFLPGAEQRSIYDRLLKLGSPQDPYQTIVDFLKQEHNRMMMRLQR